MKTIYVLLMAAGVAANMTHAKIHDWLLDRRSLDNGAAVLTSAREQELLSNVIKHDRGQFKAFLDMQTLKSHGLLPSRWLRQPMPLNEYKYLSSSYSSLPKDTLLAMLPEKNGRWDKTKNKAKKAVYEVANSVRARFTPDERKLKDFIEENEGSDLDDMRRRLEELKT